MTRGRPRTLNIQKFSAESQEFEHSSTKESQDGGIEENTDKHINDSIHAFAFKGGGKFPVEALELEQSSPKVSQDRRNGGTLINILTKSIPIYRQHPLQKSSPTTK